MNLMIGTAPSGKGGIASVIAVLIDTGFFQKYQIGYLSSHSDGTALTKLMLFFKAIGMLFRYCVFSRSCIVHVHAASHASFIRKSVLLVLARTLGAKTIFHLHGGGFKHYVTEESGAAMQWWVRRTLERSSYVIALSSEWANFLADFAPCAKVRVLANAVSVTPLSDNREGEEGRILFLGRIEQQKGIFELLSAIALLKPMYPAIKLVMAGTGDIVSVQSKIKALDIVNQVEYLGWIDADQKKQELQKACIFALPSYAEGVPMSLLEAMSAGKAIVATEVGGIPSVVCHRVSGLLVAPCQVTALAEALDNLLTDKALRGQLAERARQVIEEQYSSQQMLDKLALLYDDLCSTT